MELKVSRPVQIAALVGILAAVGGFFGFSMLGGGSGSSTAGHHLIRHPHGLRGTSAKHKKAAVPNVAKPKVTKPKATRPKATKPKVTPKPAVDANGLPLSLARAFQSSPVVVAILYDPQAKVDAASYGEAKAGAALAGVPFVAVNVMQRAQVQAISEKFSVVSDPAVLVFRGPNELFIQLDGFADKETVAQAVENALSGSALSAAGAPPGSST